MHVCIYAWMHMCTYAYMYMCIYESMHRCIYASMHLCIYAPAAARRGKNDMTNIGPNIKQSRETNTKICLKNLENGSKNHSKIDQHWSKNRPKWVPKSTKIGPKVLLESSGGHLGPKMAPRANIGSKTWFVGPPWTSKLDAENRIKTVQEQLKMSMFFDYFLDRFLRRFGANLVPI